MKLNILAQNKVDKNIKLLITNFFKEEIEKIGDIGKALAEHLDEEGARALEPLIKESIKRKEMTGELSNTVFISSTKISVLFIGSGSKDDFSFYSAKVFGASIIRNAKRLGFKSLAIHLRGLEGLGYFDNGLFQARKECDKKRAISSLVEGLYVGDYNFNILKTKEDKDKDAERRIDFIAILGAEKETSPFIERGGLIGDSINFARDLVNRPANHCTPSFLAEKAKQIEKISSCFKVSVLEEEDALKLNMGSFLSVARGSVEKAKFIVINYKPKVKKDNDKIALVGKGITFDTGGISLKPSSDMHLMKADMSGAAIVLASMQAIGRMGIEKEVVGIIPSCENMPGSKAVKPGDVVSAMNGKSIEILNTDAEGRLILADALSYAVSREKASYIIDIATLTGACMVALGEITTGLMTNNSEFAHNFIDACQISGERIWPLPLFKEYSEQIKSDVADIANIGGRYGGAITAAAFLQHFVDKTPWIHLDIAGTSWEGKGGYYSKGATAAMITSIVNFLKG